MDFNCYLLTCDLKAVRKHFFKILSHFKHFATILSVSFKRFKFNSDHGILCASFIVFPSSDLFILYFDFNFNTCQIKTNANSNFKYN